MTIYFLSYPCRVAGGVGAGAIGSLGERQGTPWEGSPLNHWETMRHKGKTVRHTHSNS